MADDRLFPIFGIARLIRPEKGQESPLKEDYFRKKKICSLVTETLPARD